MWSLFSLSENERERIKIESYNFLIPFYFLTISFLFLIFLPSHLWISFNNWTKYKGFQRQRCPDEGYPVMLYFYRVKDWTLSFCFSVHFLEVKEIIVERKSRKYITDGPEIFPPLRFLCLTSEYLIFRNGGKFMNYFHLRILINIKSGFYKDNVKICDRRWK